MVEHRVRVVALGVGVWTYQTMQLMIGFQQVDTFAVIAW